MASALATICGVGASAQEANPARASQTDDAPFANYPPDVEARLRSLHHKNAGNGLAELAFRRDFPGGLSNWQQAAREKLRTLLGLHEIARTARGHVPRVQLGQLIDAQGYTRQLGNIHTEPNVSIPFWILRPRNIQEKRPLIICAHGHNQDGWNAYAGVYSDAEQRRETLSKDGDAGIQAVQRGYIVLVPATRGLAAAAATPDVKGRHGKRNCRAQLIHCLLEGRTAVGERVWDTQRLLDWSLKHLPQVDTSRVVMLGNSGGGVLTVYVSALDERIKVAVPSCSFTSFTSSEGYVFHCDCCLVPRISSELADMPDIGGLAAPRFLLAVHGRKDGLHSHRDVELAMQRAKTIFDAANVADHFQFRWGDEGHKFYPDIMWPFIEHALAGRTQE